MQGGDGRRARLHARFVVLALVTAALTFATPLAAGADELPTAPAPSDTPGSQPELSTDDAPPPPAADATPSTSPSVDPSPAVTPSVPSTPAADPTPTSTPTTTPAPVTPLPFALALPAAPVLTLPSGDGLRDVLTVTVTAPASAPVTVTAVRLGHTVTVAKAVSLVAVHGGWSARIRVPATHLTAGSWTLRAAQAGRTVAATRALRVGSGVIHSLSLAADRSTSYPRSPGAPGRVGVTVRAADETGASVPVAGTLTASEGRASRSARIARAAPGVASVSVNGFPDGSATISAHVTGPSGAARTVKRSIHLAATVLRHVAATRSGPTVQPVIDDQLDTVTVSASATSSSGVAVPVHGDIRISRNGAVVRSWSVTSSATHRVVWDGRVGGRIVAGTYTVTVRERGPDGGTVSGTTTVAVSTAHLPYRIRVISRLASGNEQGLAIGRIDGAARLFVGVDVGGGNARIDEYDLTGKHLASSAPLPLGHAAEIAVGADGLLYVANGSATAPTSIAVVDPAGWTVVRVIDASGLGVNGMIAAVPATDPAAGFAVFANLPGQAYTVTPMSSTGAFGTSVAIADPGGVPQGIEVVGRQWWIYTSLAAGGNRITKVDPATGATLGAIALAIPGEGEGEAIDPGTGLIYVGCHGPNRFGVLEAVR